MTTLKSGYVPSQLDPTRRQQLQKTLQQSYRALEATVQATIHALEETAKLEAVEAKQQQSAEYARLLGMAADRRHRREDVERASAIRDPAHDSRESCYLAYVGSQGEVIYTKATSRPRTSLETNVWADDS